MLFLTVALLGVACSSFAQYKPEAKSISTEVQFNPFDQNGRTFRLDGLKVRYFITEKDAVRVKVGLNLDRDKFSSSSDYSDPSSSSVFDTISKSTVGDFNLNIGYERHFDVAKRLSLYVGGSLGFNRHFASSKSTSTHNYNGDIYSMEYKSRNGIPAIDGDGLFFRNKGSWRFDAAVFTGLDFYVYKGLYLGTELGLGLQTSKQGKAKMTKSDTSNGITTTTDIPDTSSCLSDTSFGFYIEPTLRLGWTF